nr:oligoendopeptidase F [bacterium]
MGKERVEYASREEIPERYRWDIERIYATEDDFLAALEVANGYPERVASFRGKISQSAESLLEFLRFDDEMSLNLGKLSNYASRKSDEDTRDSHFQALEGQVMNLYVALSAASSWFTPELMTVDDETLDRFYAEQPGLELYRRAIDHVLRMRDHTLSPDEERLLASAGDMRVQPGNIYSLFNDADLSFPAAIDSKGEEHPVTHGSYIPLMNSTDRALRKSAFEALYGEYGKFRNTCAATLAAEAKARRFFADARRFGSALEAALFGNEIPTEVYTNLIETVHANLPAMHKYVELRKELLGVDELHFYDLYTPIVEDLDMRFTYDEACELILKALEPMGERYLSIVREGLSNRWIDVYETPGKRSGGYSSGGYGMQPYILLNFQGTLDDVFTLIHEMGHSIHTYLSCANQPICYSDYVIFVAEVASTCNESLLMRYMLDHAADSRERAYLLNHFLEQFRGTLYRQCMFAEFELLVGEMTARGEVVTADALCSAYRDLNALYFGGGIVLDEEIALEWARIPHFYYNYYVYQYSTGYAAAIALSQRILSGEPEALE